jgi:arylsulfatase A-like enzyme
LALLDEPMEARLVLFGTVALTAVVALTAAASSLLHRRWWRLVPAFGLAIFPFAHHAARYFGLEDGFPSTAVSLCGASLVALVTSYFLSVSLGRRVFVSACLSIVLVALVSAVSASWQTRGSKLDKPNVVLLVLDTTRVDRLTPYAPELDTTPSLADFAEESLVYEQAWSVSPWTPPSHASMFTGCLPAEHGVDGSAQPSFRFDGETLQGLFSATGYSTGGFVANPNLHAPGWSVGFDTYEAPWAFNNHSIAKMVQWFSDGGGRWELEHGTSILFRKARSWWRRQVDRPRYLFVNLIDPHRPYRPLPDAYGKFLGDLDEATAYGVDQDPVSYHLEPGIPDYEAEILRSLYDGELWGMDREVGKFVEWLRERGELDNTVFVITSDHGERLGERGWVGHDLVMDRYLLHIPLIIRYPEKVPPGRESRRVQLPGLPGHLLHLADLEAPGLMDERAFHRTQSEVVVAQYQHPGWFLERMLNRAPGFDASPYEGDWNYVANSSFALTHSSAEEAPPFLVQMDPKPLWRTNLFEVEPRAAGQLLEVAEALPRFKQAAEERTLSEEDTERLRALGYVD